MAERNDEATAATKPKKAKGGKTKKLVLVLALAAALGAGAYKFVLAPSPPADAEQAEQEAPPEEGEILELPEMVINLANAETRYARVGLALVLEEGIVAKDFEARSAIAKDVALSYLSAFSFEQLRDPATKEHAKAEL